MAILAFRLSRITIIGPTPTTIIQGIIPIALISVGEVIRDINIITTISIGITTGQDIMTRDTIMAIEEAINVVTTATVIGNTIRGIMIDVNGDVSSPFQKIGSPAIAADPFFNHHPDFYQRYKLENIKFPS
jgi:hypothetical protein